MHRGVLTPVCAIDAALARRLIAAQFPQWAGLPVTPVERSGWDNRTFHLGEERVVRLPSAAPCEAQVEKEQRWLPALAPALPFPIPQPVGLGAPGCGFPWKWSILRWLPGDPVEPPAFADSEVLAADVATFLRALQRADPAGGPAAGAHSFHRGGSLAAYDGEVRVAIRRLGSRVDAIRVASIWEGALDTAWAGPPVWVHGDVSPGNLLQGGGRLRGVIDFGQLAVGDPACDLSIAWTLFRGPARQRFIDAMEMHPDAWLRAKAWALWKGLVVAAGLSDTTAVEWQNPFLVIETVGEGT